METAFLTLCRTLTCSKRHTFLVAVHSYWAGTACNTQAVSFQIPWCKPKCT